MAADQPDRVLAHLIDADGVTQTPFARDADGSWSNTKKITLLPGAVLDFGRGMTIANGQSLEFTYETILRLDDS